MSENLPFEPVPTEIDFSKYERGILGLWQQRDVARRVAQRGEPGRGTFVFYEGPPTANGLPHNGSVLTRVMKDVFPRYHSMLGKRVLRRGGWDTHGLPVEVEVEKELRIHGKEAIVEYGVEPFVRRCIDSVFRYTAEWENLDRKLAYWVSHDDAYVTYHRSYVESCWWALSELFRKGLLYQGHKVLWWWAQGGTALSSGEVGMGYRSVEDPAATVGLPLVDEPETALVVWTTTPWTLPSNAYAAVNPAFDYVKCRLGKPLDAPEGQEENGNRPPSPALCFTHLIVAGALRTALEAKLGHRLVVESTFAGRELVGQRYRPPFDYYYSEHCDELQALKDGSKRPRYFRVLGADFVSLDSGTGIVHIAPAFGEDDHKVHARELALYQEPESVPLLCAIEPTGRFKSEAGPYAGRWIKDCDPDIIAELAERQLLVLRERYRHDYPFCWRAENDPLIQLARPAWFIRTTAHLDAAKANNQAVEWLPTHIKSGRFGDFLDNNVDWALSRERFWGTPLNVWVCSQDAQHLHAPASVQEIESLNPEAFAHFRQSKAADPTLSDHLMVHKPWIDSVKFPCPDCGGSMHRVPEVIDCWFDSGCMPFAQWGFPHQAGSTQAFDDNFPADFISEAIDQTRGWFYSLLMVSSLVFDKETQARVGLSSERTYPHPFKNCIVLGHVGDRDGKKESKSRGNYTPPEVVLDRVGMDFAVVHNTEKNPAEEGHLWVGREDLQGMDLQEGARLRVSPPGCPERAVELVARGSRALPRRVAVLPQSLQKEWSREPAPSGLSTRAVEVPSLAEPQRIRVEDATTQAPGADAFRWFFYASSPPWNNTRHSLHNVRLQQKDFLVKLRNVYSFFTIYANIDNWKPGAESLAPEPSHERPLLDRWILSELHLCIVRVRTGLEGFQSYDAALCLESFAESLSNWYLRRSRSRFWGPGLAADKRNAFGTLHEVLVTLAKLLAPFVPFFAEELYQNLSFRAKLEGHCDSVHLESYPEAESERIDQTLVEDMAAVREVVSLGLSVRAAHKLKVRQPLSQVDVVFNDAHWPKRVEAYRALIEDELNVRQVKFMHAEHQQGAIRYNIKPNFRALGPRLGKRVQRVKAALQQADGGALYTQLSREGHLSLEVDGQPMRFSPEEIAVTASATEGFAADSGDLGVVVLHTVLTPSLLDEGLLREVVSRVQAARKQAKLGFADRIHLRLGGSERVRRVALGGAELIQRECLASQLEWADLLNTEASALGDEQLRVHLKPVT